MAPQIPVPHQVRYVEHVWIRAKTENNVDARFEVLGQTFSLLSASLAPSTNLYTRKGTLVGFNGKPENVRYAAKYEEMNKKG